MVYVDNANLPFGRMRMCHMVADSHQELLEMADTIGVARRWIQNQGTRTEHFDICRSKRAKAIEAGAIEVDHRQMGRILYEKGLRGTPQGSM